MSTSTFPGGGTAYRFLGPKAPGHPYSAIFRAKGDASAGDGALASVNAGNPGLWVTGAGSNLAFATALGAFAQDFQSLHGYALAGSKLGHDYSTNYQPGDAVRLIAIQRPGAAALKSAAPAEAVFLDIFADGAKPEGEPSNAAMVYAVPPDGSVPGVYSDAEFLGSIARTAENIVTLIATYNATLTTVLPGLPTIAVLRTCLFGGGIFKPPSMKGHPEHVAKAIFDGFTAALAAAASGIAIVEFENGDHGFDSLT